MPVINGYEAEEDALLTATKLMAISARTAPKARGIDRVATVIVTGEEKERIAKAMEEKVERKRNLLQMFRRDAENLRKSQAALTIGVKGTEPKGVRILLIVALADIYRRRKK